MSKILLFLFLLVFQLSLNAYTREENQKIFIETIKYIEEHNLPPLEVSVHCGCDAGLREGNNTPVCVEKTTTFQMVRTLIMEGFNPLVLDMANATRPGGSVVDGDNAQEETLCCQSNLYMGLKEAFSNGYYPIPEFGGILVKGVSFFRDENYNFLDECYQADVFASAAYDCNIAHKPDLEKGLRGYDRPEREEDYQKGMKAKIRTLLQTAKQNGNDALVLSAFGCGAFKNNPKIVAQWYKEVINEADFQGVFQIITFAIKGHDKDENFEVFKGCFTE